MCDDDRDIICSESLCTYIERYCVPRPALASVRTSLGRIRLQTTVR